jgi:undecaprenyl-diphosphatase
MIDLLRDLSDWVVGFAGTDWAILALAVTSFVESIFFPIPPDLLLIGIGIVQPNLAIWLGALVALSSVAGALVGYWIGGRYGRPILYRMFPVARVQMVERMFNRYGMMAILIAAITPIPYKIFAISAGALDLDKRTFIVASLIGRGVRYITVGLLIFVFGESIQAFIADNFGGITFALAVAAIVAVAAWGLVHRRRARGARP